MLMADSYQNTGAESTKSILNMTLTVKNIKEKRKNLSCIPGCKPDPKIKSAYE